MYEYMRLETWEPSHKLYFYEMLSTDFMLFINADYTGVNDNIKSIIIDGLIAYMYNYKLSKYQIHTIMKFIDTRLCILFIDSLNCKIIIEYIIDNAIKYHPMTLQSAITQIVAYEDTNIYNIINCICQNRNKLSIDENGRELIAMCVKADEFGICKLTTIHNKFQTLTNIRLKLMQR